VGAGVQSMSVKSFQRVSSHKSEDTSTSVQENSMSLFGSTIRCRTFSLSFKEREIKPNMEFGICEFSSSNSIQNFPTRVEHVG